MVIMMSYMLPEKPVCRSRSKLEVDMEQQTGSKLGKVKRRYRMSYHLPDSFSLASILTEQYACHQEEP